MNIAKLKIAELKKALKERGLPTTGNKGDLAARLREALGVQDLDTSLPEEDIEVNETALLAEEEDEEAEETADLDTKLLESTTAPTAIKPKKIIINREAAEQAQQAAEQAKAAEGDAPEAVEPEQPEPAATAPPASKKIRLSTLTEMDRLAMRSKNNLENVKILTAEERKAARLAKFGGGGPGGDGQLPATDASEKTITAQRPPADLDVLKKRADRFGEITSNKVKTLESQERLAKRKERFGVVSSDDAKARRAARFNISTATTTTTSTKTVSRHAPVTAPGADASLEQKKQQRAARFGSS